MQQDVPADDMKPELRAWLEEKERPQVIWDLARSHPPDGEYRLATDLEGDTYRIESYCEDGTMRVTRYGGVLGYECAPMWQVFGMKPEDLVRIDEA